MIVNEKAFLLKIICDNRLGMNHLKTLIYAMNQEEITAPDITEYFSFHKSHTSKILRDLIKYEYIIEIGRKPSTRIMRYTLL